MPVKPSVRPSGYRNEVSSMEDSIAKGRLTGKVV